MACRINHVRAWTARIVIEAMCHPQSLFVTLTYSDENLPRVEFQPWWPLAQLAGCDMWPSAVGADMEYSTLAPRDLELFMKRLRKALDYPIRFFAVGEYGPRTMRPHYHAILFGMGELEARKVGRFVVHPAVQEAWDLGYTSCGEFNETRAAYVAQYTTKKLTSITDERSYEQLRGRHPEFSRQSRRPGIGGMVPDHLAEALLKADPVAEDVPTTIRLHDGKEWPMPRYIAVAMREALGMEPLAEDRPPRVTRWKDPAAAITHAKEAERKTARRRKRYEREQVL